MMRFLNGCFIITVTFGDQNSPLLMQAAVIDASAPSSVKPASGSRPMPGIVDMPVLTLTRTGQVNVSDEASPEAIVTSSTSPVAIDWLPTAGMVRFVHCTVRGLSVSGACRCAGKSVAV